MNLAVRTITVLALVYGARVAAQPPATAPRVLVFDGTRAITGDGMPPIENARIVVRDGRIAAIGPRAGVVAPSGATQIDLSGRTLMPMLVDVHGHIGYMKGAITDRANYSRENVLNDLRRFSYYGVGVFQALGTDRSDTEIRIRNEQRAGILGDRSLATLFTAGTGIVAPTPGSANGGPFFATDVVHETDSPEDARAFVGQLAAKQPDFVKIWVDDRNGTKKKLRPEVSAAAIAEAHALGLRAVAHVYYLDDAKLLAKAGIDGFAHLVRAEPGVDDELAGMIRSRNIFQCSTLSIQRSLVDGPGWLDDPALAETVPPAVIATWKDQVAKTSSDTVARARTDYARLERNLRTIHQGGARIVLCGDTGLASQVPGFTEHRELEAIVRAGVPALEAIRAATGTAASVLGLQDRGTLRPGARADFIVLAANPLQDIANTRKIVAVYRDGIAIDRAPLRASLLASWQ
jgi:imidazolonepropionase-like amidohydrolase